MDTLFLTLPVFAIIAVLALVIAILKSLFHLPATYSKRALETEAKSLLLALWTSEVSYHQDIRSYTTDLNQFGFCPEHSHFAFGFVTAGAPMSGVVGANGDPKVDQNRKEVMDLIDQHRCISETGKALAPSDLAAGVPRISKIRELCLECTATSDSFKVLVWSQPHDDLIDAWTIDEKKHVEHLTKQAKDIH